MTNPTPSRPTPFTDSVSFLARAQYTNGQYEECVTAKDARTLESQRDEARELLIIAKDLLESHTTGHLEESDKVVCICCERSVCAPDCEVDQFLRKLETLLNPKK